MGKLAEYQVTYLANSACIATDGRMSRALSAGLQGPSTGQASESSCIPQMKGGYSGNSGSWLRALLTTPNSPLPIFLLIFNSSAGISHSGSPFVCLPRQGVPHRKQNLRGNRGPKQAPRQDITVTSPIRQEGAFGSERTRTSCHQRCSCAPGFLLKAAST